jgi:hypothetical protein
MTTSARSKNSFISHNLFRSFEIVQLNSTTLKATHVPAALGNQGCQLTA